MKILIVDDSKVIVKTLVIMLKKTGYENLETASSVNEALFKLRKEKFDLIISDWKMPEQTGVDLLKIIRKNPATMNIPFIMATSMSEKNKIVEALKLGVQGYLTKPISYNVLVNKLNDIAIQFDLDRPSCEIPKLDKITSRNIQSEVEEVETEKMENHHTDTHISSYKDFKENVVYEKHIWNNSQTFPYFFGSGIGKKFIEVITSYYGDKDFFLLANDIFFKESELYKELKKITNGHEIKMPMEALTIENCGGVITELKEMGLDKKSVLIGLGGVDILGISGFLGSNYMGGISTIWIPTTFSGILNVSLFPNFFINSKSTFQIFNGPFSPSSVYVDFEILLLLKKEKYDGGIAELIRPTFYFDTDFSKLILSKIEMVKEGDWEALKELIVTVLLKKISGITQKKGGEIKEFAVPFINALNEYYCGNNNVQSSTFTRYALEIILTISNKMNLLSTEAFKYYSKLIEIISDTTNLPPFNPQKLLKCLYNDNHYHTNLFLPKDIGVLHSFNDIEIRNKILEGFEQYFKKM